MRIGLILIAFFVVGKLNAQIDLQDAPWKKLPCDTLQTQLEMNFCSAKKIRMADSVMKVLYNSILNSLDKEIKSQVKISNPNDNDRQHLKSLNERIRLFKESQLTVERYVKSIQGYVSEEFSGGSIRTLMVNQWGLGLTEERIKLLHNMIEEFGLK